MILCGLDIGGTFTVRVVAGAAGRVVSAKAPSTPRDFAVGLMDALEAAARDIFAAVLDEETGCVDAEATAVSNPGAGAAANQAGGRRSISVVLSISNTTSPC